MIKNSTQPMLLQKLFELLKRRRVAFVQERTYWRVVGMVLGEIFNFGRHTVIQGLKVLEIIDGDLSGWYRLFNKGRYEEPRGKFRKLSKQVTGGTQRHFLTVAVFRPWRGFGRLCRAGIARTLDVLICVGSLKPYRV